MNASGTDKTIVTRAKLRKEPPGVTEVVDLLRGAETDRLMPIRVLARGAMGRIELARDRALNRPVARKTLRAEHCRDPFMVSFFLREAQVTSVLEHPNIVPVHSLGLDESGNLQFTMKLVGGRTLHEIIHQLPPGPIEHSDLLDLVDVMIKVCDGLSIAHRLGIAHCDVKPENIMVGEFGEVYVMDWGIAQSTGTRNDGLSIYPLLPEGTIMGTPGYMSPEQVSGQTARIGPWTDVFCVGAVLFEIVARRAPYAGYDYSAIVECSASGTIPRLDDAASVPKVLRQIVERAMAPRCEDRYQSANELKGDLVAFTRGSAELVQKEFDRGETIIREGEPGDAAYIIKSGSCEVFEECAGKQVHRAVLQAGDVFGEAAILAPGPRMATVVALERTTVQVVEGSAIQEHLDMLPVSVSVFVRAMASRYRELDTAFRRG